MVTRCVAVNEKDVLLNNIKFATPVDLTNALKRSKYRSLLSSLYMVSEYFYQRKQLIHCGVLSRGSRIPPPEFEKMR